MTETDVVAEITALQKRFVQAQEFGEAKPLDIERIMSFYALACVLWDVVTPLQFAGEQAIRENVAELFGSLRSLSIKLRELAVHGDRQFAVARCILELTAIGARGGTSRMTCRITECWQKENGQWRIIHEHASMPGDLRGGQIEFNAS
jgi:ketosteroid isomerase-like protein